MINIAIFASGTGSNAVQIMDHFESHLNIKISLIVSNNSKAKVLESAIQHNISQVIINKSTLQDSEYVLGVLNNKKIDFIVLAGFLLLIPKYMVDTYNKRIINIHPALLPKYGGKGMYGHNVHKSVYENKEKESGITIHFVNTKYDDGSIIFQESVQINETDTPNCIAQKVLQLEHKNYKLVIENLLLKE